MEEGPQRTLKRMRRATLGALPSTPIAFLGAEGGSIPARARLDRRQEGFAARLCSSTLLGHRRTIQGATHLGTRLCSAVGLSASEIRMVEVTGPAR